MRHYGSKSKLRGFLESGPILAILLVIVLTFAWNVFGFWGKMRSTLRNKELAEEKVLGLQMEKESLSESIERIDTPEGIEESIREKFGLAKEGEGLIVIVEDEDNGGLEEKKDKGGFWSFLGNLFK